MRRRTAFLVAIAVSATVGACGGGSDAPTTVRVRDAVVIPGTQPAAATVTMAITASRSDAVTAVRVLEPARARAELVVLGGASGGDGHLGHLDPGGSDPHAPVRSLALPAHRTVRLTTNGSRITLSGLPGPPAGPVRLRLVLGGGTTEVVEAAPAPG